MKLCFENGLQPNWKNLHTHETRGSVVPPKLPTSISPGCVHFHPLVQQWILMEAGWATQSNIRLSDCPQVNDHRLDNLPILPATYFVELAMHVIRETSKHKTLCTPAGIHLHDLKFTSPLVMPSLISSECCLCSSPLDRPSPPLTHTALLSSLSYSPHDFNS